LLTRFTTRRKNISWRTEQTQAALETAAQLLNQQTHWHTKLRLSAGQGIITRNILHSRSGFDDGNAEQGRQMLRGRCRQRPHVLDTHSFCR